MAGDGKIPPATSETEFGAQRAGDLDPSSLNDIGKNIGSAYAAALVYLSTQLDRLRAAVRNLVILSILGIIALVFLATVLIFATVLLVEGVAGAVSSQMGIPPWAGDLITGGVILTAIVIAGFVAIRRITSAARVRTISNYAKQKGQR